MAPETAGTTGIRVASNPSGLVTRFERRAPEDLEKECGLLESGGRPLRITTYGHPTELLTGENESFTMRGGPAAGPEGRRFSLPPERSTASGEVTRSDPTTARQIVQPAPTLYPRARQHHRLTVNVRTLAIPFWAIVVSKALQSGFPISHGQLDVEHDPEEGVDRAVMRVYTPASATQTMAFWDNLAEDMDRWLQRLSVGQRATVLVDIGLRFHWAVNV